MKNNQRIVSIVLLTAFVFMLLSAQTPVLASEEETIDSFNVHPGGGRWRTIESTITPVVDRGVLVINDTGDNSWDICSQERDLSTTDDRVSIRFRMIHQGGTAEVDGFLSLFLSSGYMNDHITSLVFSSLFGNTSINVLFRYEVAGVGHDKNMSLLLENNTWYVAEFTYNLLKSKYSIKIKSDSGSSLASWDEADLFTFGRPDLFNQELVTVVYRAGVYTSASFWSVEIDYIDAPFKEHAWTQTTTATDPQWLEDTWHLARAEDVVADDASAWSLNVPALDFVSGVMSIQPDATITSASDLFQFLVSIYGVDGDDGGLHAIVKVQLSLDNAGCSVQIFDGNNNLVDQTSTSTTGIWPKASFSISLQDSRSRVDTKARAWLDGAASTTYSDLASTLDVASFVTDPSAEFVVQFYYRYKLNTNTEVVEIVEDFGFEQRDIFADIVNGIIAPIGNFLLVIFAELFRFVAGVFVLATALLLAGLQPILESIFSAVGQIGSDVFSFFSTILNTISTAITDVAGDIFTWLWGAVGEASSFIESVLTDFLGTMSEVIDAWLGFIDAVIQDGINNVLIPLIETILTNLGLDELIDFVATFIEDVGSILSIAIEWFSNTIGFIFASIVFWSDLGRLGALVFTIGALMAVYLLEPIIGLLKLGINQWALEDITDTFAEIVDRSIRLFEMAFTLFSWILDVIFGILQTIGGFIPFT